MTAFLLLLLVAQDPMESGDELCRVKRVYVDKFGGGEGASQVRDMIVAALHRARLFVVTENPERADAVLRGSAEDLVFTDVFQSSAGINARTGVALGHGSTSSRNRESIGLQAGVGDQESVRIQERKHEASASVRLINKEGDVIWSTTQESQGAKFRSASADVADRITKALVEDWGKAKKSTQGELRGEQTGGGSSLK